jgi:hypothetical protein
MIRGYHSPDDGSQATPEELAEAIGATTVDYVGGNEPPPPARHFTVDQMIGLTMLVVIPLVVVSITLRGKGAQPAGARLDPHRRCPAENCGAERRITRRAFGQSFLSGFGRIQMLCGASIVSVEPSRRLTTKINP